MHMKNTKAVFLIILGSFLLAMGFAYAKEDGPAMQKLLEIAGDNTPAVDTLRAAGVQNTAGLTRGAAGVNLTANTRAAAAAAVPKATAPAKVDKPKPMEAAKKWIGKNFDEIVASAAVGFIAFLIIGTGIGGLLVGLAFFGFVKFKNSL